MRFCIVKVNNLTYFFSYFFPGWQFGSDNYAMERGDAASNLGCIRGTFNYGRK